MERDIDFVFRIHICIVDLNTDCKLSSDFDFVKSTAISGICNR